MALSVCCWSAVGFALAGVGLFAAVAASAPSGDALRLTSPAFGPGGAIPDKYTCAGADVSPALDWNEPPQGTRSLALVVSDPDAQAVAGYTWMHWIVYGLPPDIGGLPEAFASGSASSGVRFGNNHFGRLHYGGPCPPKGRAHHYHFTLYALDATLDLKEGATADALLATMRGHILAVGELVGIYARR
jgi:Raf kinase inhibitor-like YbhB/YbcL family protein